VKSPAFTRIHVIDSHTGGEPTRIIIEGAPVPDGAMDSKLSGFRSIQDHIRRAIINEPRGADVLVGGLLTPPVARGSVAGIVFFNNVGYLGMCGHGTIGLIATLAYLGRIGPGSHCIDTPVGTIGVSLEDSGAVTVRNVPAYRFRKSCRITVPGHGDVSGDIAWGGNWFYICEDHGLRLTPDRIPALLSFAAAIQLSLARSGITGADGAVIDHVELCGPSASADSRNFVLCPGGAYDRSPCGTGTSAKLACLAADGLLAPGAAWRQESIIGSLFEARYDLANGRIHPAITGRAFVTGECTLLLDPDDPFVHGIPLAHL